jgi:hypothetical protein
MFTVTGCCHKPNPSPSRATVMAQRWRRRDVLRLGAVLAVWCVASAHTPYRQWQVYRRRHLLIGTSKTDARSYALGKQIVSVLAQHLPESSPRVTRGPDPWRLASLLTTAQLEVVVLAEADVAALRDGRPPFEAFGPTELRTLFCFGAHWLVVRPDFPDRHAWQVVRTLSQHAEELASAAPAKPAASPVPVHAGALAYAAGEPLPPPEAAQDAGMPHDHVH